MSLGVFAGIASIVKIVAAARFGSTGDPVNESVGIGMWSLIEELVGVIVICVPCLRSLFQRFLGYFGVWGSRIKHATHSKGYGRTYEHDEHVGVGAKVESSRSRSRSRLATMLNPGDADAESGIRLKVLGTQQDEDGGGSGVWKDEGMKRGEIWCTREVRVENEILGHVPSNEHLRGGPQAAWVDESFDIVDAPRFGRAI